MVTDPKRKTRLKVCLMIGIGGGFLAGCASREPVATPVPAEFSPPLADKAVKTRQPPTLTLVPSRPRNVRDQATSPKLPEEWIFRKVGPTQPSLSLFEESILLGQVRSTLKTLPDATKVQTVKLQNRSALLGVSAEVTAGTAAQIGETLLQKTRLDEVRVKPIQ